MTWMNEMEIDEAVRVFAQDPVLGPASRYLSDYRHLINRNSDGWPYWSAGTRPAGTLCEILSAAMTNRYRQDPRYVRPTLDDVKKAVRRIKSFVTRNKYMQSASVSAPVLTA